MFCSELLMQSSAQLLLHWNQKMHSTQIEWSVLWIIRATRYTFQEGWFHSISEAPIIVLTLPLTVFSHEIFLTLTISDQGTSIQNIHIFFILESRYLIYLMFIYLYLLHGPLINRLSVDLLINRLFSHAGLWFKVFEDLSRTSTNTVTIGRGPRATESTWKRL